MTRSQQSDEWKKQMMDAVAEDFDVKHQVLQKLHEQKKHKEAYFMKKKISLILAATLVLGATTAFAAMKVYELKNDQGEVVVKVNETQTKPEVLESTRDIINEVRETLKPGASVAVYVPGPENPDKNVRFMQAPLMQTNHSALQTEVGSFVGIPTELVGGYKFSEGFIHHQVNYSQPELFESMIQEAEKNNKKVVVRDLPIDPRIDRLNITYKGTKGEVFLILTNFEKVKWVSSEAGPDETVEKVTVQKKEALYHVQKLEDKETKYVEFYNDKKKQLLEVRTVAAEITKEDLLAIAEKLK
ncbi:hypothetical protein [Brevibacillus sp. NRS-1366]|uniref:hypothetical protein n=1 Tax=Brevibacillus sp. NRS-1366 TaxID=3233899 RepID=UPI003D1B4A0E